MPVLVESERVNVEFATVGAKFGALRCVACVGCKGPTQWFRGVLGRAELASESRRDFPWANDAKTVCH